MKCVIFGEALTSCDIWLENGVVGSSTLPLPLTLSSSSYHLTYMSEDGKDQYHSLNSLSLLVTITPCAIFHNPDDEDIWHNNVLVLNSIVLMSRSS